MDGFGSVDEGEGGNSFRKVRNVGSGIVHVWLGRYCAVTKYF